MTFIDLFAGVGGFRRGMELAGHECKGFCEWDKYAAASYISMHLITEDQRKYLATLDKKKRQKEILKDEYRNGEWYSNDIRNVDAGSVPKVDCWCFGAPCQDFSIAGLRKGLDGDRSSLIREVFRILREEREKDRPEWLIYENVKGMLSSNRGGDYLAILMEMDELGYDTEWQIFNSKNWGVPQNRERVYTIGRFRAKGSRKIFPIGRTDGEDSIQVRQIGQLKSERDNKNQYRVYEQGGVSPCLNSMEGGGREPHIPVTVSRSGIGGGYDSKSYLNGKGLQGNRQSRNDGGDPQMFGIDFNIGGEERTIANTIKARYDAGVTNFRQDGTAVCVRIE
jgi:DNA (cytosine-5)-methyltransferase 1